MRLFRERPDIRIAAIFVVIASGWIFFSDSFMFMLFPNLKEIHTIGTVKGLLFVFVTGAILFWLLHREQQRQRLQQSEIHALNALLQSVLEPMEDVLFVIDDQYRIRYHTTGSLSAAGAAALVREGELIWHVLPSGLPASLESAVTKVLSGHPEVSLKVADAGGRQWVARVYGIPTGACLMLEDVSKSAMEEEERRHMHLEREELLMRLQMHVDRMPIGYIVTDADFRFVYLNPAAERMFGFTNHELKGKLPYGTIFADSSRPSVEEKRRGWITGSLQAHGTIGNLTKDGRHINCEWFNTPVLNKEGDFAQLISMVQDVTDVTRMIEALRISETRYRTLIERANDGILTIRNGVFVSCNPSAARMLGMRENDIVGARPQDISPILQGDDGTSEDLANSYLQHALSGETPVFEWLHLHSDGREVVMEVSLSRAEQEGEIHVLCLWRDVTLRRQYENDLLESRSRLRALAARLDDVREEERVRLSREIHDGLGQSLTGLKIDLSLLNRALNHDAEPPLEVAEIVGSMEHILDDTIIQTRQLARQLRPGMLGEVGISDAIRQYMREFRQRSGMEVKLALPTERLLLSQRQQLALYRITQEAVTNIVRHSEASSIDVRLELLSGIVILEVADNGRGIQPGDLSKAGSLGIVGMSERAELLAGFCRIVPRAGGGTVVHIELPCESDGSSARPLH
jgi:PAS domain S-box-containing protein